MLLDVSRMYICIAFKSVRPNIKVAPRMVSCLPVSVISVSKFLGGADNVEFPWSLRTIIILSLDARSVDTTEGSNAISHELSARLGSKSCLPSPQSMRNGGDTVASTIFLISSSLGRNLSSRPANTASRC
mmetsp:Transcript_5279/g.14164  ORF Transcript_5279/g.14164 Transcript_5279/m.14164 type:complete len:130 (-) Transcript_5279:704-1093(-)